MTSITTTHAAAVEVADFAVTGLDASERIGQTMARPRAKRLRRTLFVAGLAGGAAASYADPAIWSRVWSIVAPAAGVLVEAVRQAPTATVQAPQAAEGTQAAVPEIPAERATPVAPEALAAPATEAGAIPTAAPMPAPTVKPPEPPVSKPKQTESARPAGDAYAAPKGMPADPVAKRAEAAGLHPDLSPALLQRLSEADFKAATIAIGKALKEVGDTETFIWPQKAAKGATRFRVSFVHGAPEGCRRYVVEIAKDGWQTTALPVETCGVRKLAAKRG